VWIYCGSGYRASIAASILDRPGRDVVLINDSYDNAAAAGIEPTQASIGVLSWADGRVDAAGPCVTPFGGCSTAQRQFM
jgi:purine nucleoside permease